MKVYIGIIKGIENEQKKIVFWYLTKYLLYIKSNRHLMGFGLNNNE